MVLLDINQTGLQKVCTEINSNSSNKLKASFYKCDITKIEEVRDVCKSIKENIGDPTILINNAGIVAGKYLTDLEYQEFLKTYEVNVLSNFILVKDYYFVTLEYQL